MVKTFDSTKSNFCMYYCSCCCDKMPGNRKCRDEGLFVSIDVEDIVLHGGESIMAGDSAEGARGSWPHHKCFSEAESREK